MPLNVAEMVWSRAGIDGPVKVRWGKVVTGERFDLVAAAGRGIFVFTPSEDQYATRFTTNVETEVLSLAVGLPTDTGDSIVLGVEDRIIVYGVTDGGLVRILETDPEPGARFVGLSLADLDGDGRQEVVAAAEGKQAFYVYTLIGEASSLRLSLMAIRVLPGPAQKATAFELGEGLEPAVAAAYSLDSTSGLAIFIFTERGFAEGPFQELPARITSLTSGDIGPRPREELAWGGSDGSIRVVEVDTVLDTPVVSNNLGTAVPATTVGRLPGGVFLTLVAGTPEGFLFGFTAPVSSSKPDWAVRVARPVNDIAVSEEGLLGLGTADGSVLVWLLSAGGRLVHIVRQGETLTSIARLYNTTAAEIAVLNNVQNPDLIFPGRRLVMP